ncbi:hypothetical protein RND81_07G173700 [Saponaria officinalis]|uniref:Glycosyltransferase n=1 Tax=Saponaria officinalis TaxID=3572 RepID=A0AAW1JS03_SAPOF
MKGQSNPNVLSNTQNGLNSQICVVMVPFPAQGHLNQLLQLSLLISSYGVPVNYTGSPSLNRQVKHRLQGRPVGGGDNLVNKIHFHDFELPHYESLPPNPNPSMHFPVHVLPLWEAYLHLREPVSELIRQLSVECRRIVVIYDSLMVYVVQDVANIQNVELFSFAPIGAFALFLSWFDMLDGKLPFEVDSSVIPQCDIPSDEGCFMPEMEKIVAEKIVKYLGLEAGSLHNTSRVIEGKYIEVLEKLSGKKCFAIGPVNPVEIEKLETETPRHECLEWLDGQEKNSVIYVSFGTTTSITDEQIKELAVGFEKSGQKFIWVLRDADKGDGFSEDVAVRRPELPEGYEERVKNRGIVVREWAPQLEILAHSSTGGFLSHCGWNSCLESMSMGVPMATWPMHSDQPRNTVLVTEVLRIGTVVRNWARRGELVSSDHVEKAVTRLMESEEGAEMRERADKLGEEVRRSVSGGGCSCLEMDSFITRISR